ncbi:hypothetical protein [Blastococcus montanus]|uniref:hypothetical protein n=1 Tax=Blastococcus montanus TaxID=3144973 RepID=UPI00320A6C24
MLQAAADRYDYTPLLRRTDPTIAPLIPIDLVQAVDVAAEMTGDLTATLPLIADIWQQVSPDLDTTANMLGVLAAFTTTATAAGATAWHDVPTELIAEFIHAPGPSAGDVCRLRKNVVHGAYLALYDAGLFDVVSPAAGVDPVPGQVRTDDRGSVRTATHDEMLILRLASRLAVSSRAVHLSAAAVAICSASATTTEAPQVLWGHADLTGDARQLALAGSPSATNDDEARIEARIVTLDPWEAEVLTDWHTELQAKDKPGKTSRVAPATSVLYTGKQALDSNSAHVGADQQVRKAFAIADLGRELGFSAGSLRLWAAARHVTSFATLITGATIAGIDPFTLHRQVTRGNDHGRARTRA